MLYEHADCAVFIDPLENADDPAFWSWADDRCRDHEVVVLETIHFHRRSREAFLARYAATTLAPESACPPHWGVEARRPPATEETVYWIPEHRALVPGNWLPRLHRHLDLDRPHPVPLSLHGIDLPRLHRAR